jgi:hypothetical protein
MIPNIDNKTAAPKSMNSSRPNLASVPPTNDIRIAGIKFHVIDLDNR